MTEYKDTLNLPTTVFPMKASLAIREPELLAQWKQKAIYQKIREARSGATRFILHDGPPYANGHLHCGHALNKILKDIIIKSKTFSGYDAPFVPGWDCHGLPVELNVEKKLGRAGAKVTAAAFRSQCRDYAASQIDIQREEFQRLGVLGDWYRPYMTMDYRYEANVVRVLGLMIQNGYVQQGFKPVHWCIDCGSALAEAEVEYEEKISPSIDVAFLAVNPLEVFRALGKQLESKPICFPIWTTTPWTLVANEAVCLHPEIDYCVIDVGTSYFIVASELAESVMTRYQHPVYRLAAQVKGRVFEHILVQHPFAGRQVPIVLGMHVTTDSGTGCVHTAPAHGPEDYLVGQAYGLPLINPVKNNGCFSDEVPFFGGLSVLKVNEPVLELLRDRGALLAQQQLSHSYPHCWRHKSPMIFLATPQWFISMEKGQLREALIRAIDQVQWVPDWGKARIAKMVENRPDWCISRQRAWGTPMPLFVHKETRALHPQTLEWIEAVALLIEQSGIDAWFELEPSTLLGDEAVFYDKVMDTMDVWLDAGVSHYTVLKSREDLAFPADVYFEGSDQHRGWFNSSLTTSVAMYGVAPYKTVLTHGYTVDAEGKKLSKSKGNYVALDRLVQLYGADVLRLWVASTDYRHEVSISEEIMKRTSDAYRRIRNTVRFLLANLFDFESSRDALPANELLALDKWALKRSWMLQQEIISAYEQFQFHVIYQKIHNFCAVDMGGFYLDLIKDRQYTMAKEAVGRRSCQTAMYHILRALTVWIAPILSFTAEEIAAYIPGFEQESIFLSQWYEDWPDIDGVNMEDWERLHVLRDEVNKALEEQRNQGLIGSSLAAEVTLYADETMFPRLTAIADELRFLLISSEAVVKELSTAPAGLLQTESGVMIQVLPSPHEKCVRCWHRRPEVGSNLEHPQLCLRCINTLKGLDEKRRFI